MNTSAMVNKLMGVVAVGALSLGVLGGCSQNITADTVRSDMSPELETLALTHEQHMNRDAGSEDTTMRQIHDDWDSVWLMRRPSRMHRITVP